jgi:hypothetical protein
MQIGRETIESTRTIGEMIGCEDYETEGIWCSSSPMQALLRHMPVGRLRTLDERRRVGALDTQAELMQRETYFHASRKSSKCEPTEAQ